jgi:hypothetical protein
VSTIRQPSLFATDEPAKAVRNGNALRAPFPYFGGKSGVSDLIWYAFGEVKQYIEPFMGSAAVLLAAPKPASLEVAGDVNCYVANFWRAVKHQPQAVAEAADYPVSHIDLAARHRWLVDPERTAVLVAALADPEWPGDAKIAGWWCWGQCAWIGSGWCDRPTDRPTVPLVGGDGTPTARSRTSRTAGGDSIGGGQIPHLADAGQGLQRTDPIRRTRRARSAVERERERESSGRAGADPRVGHAGQGASLAAVFL